MLLAELTSSGPMSLAGDSLLPVRSIFVFVVLGFIARLSYDR